MAWASITLKPGINIEATPTLNQTGYTNSQLIRWKGGLAQKLGGWSMYYPVTVDGSPRFTHAWQDLAGGKHLALGTTTDLEDICAGAYLNIGPQLLTSNVTADFATIIGSNIVTIVDPTLSGITTSAVVFFNTPVSVGGIVLSGPYQVNTVVGATSYTIKAATNASTTVASPGGAVPTFTTTLGSSSVTVTIADHGLAAGDDIVFPLPTTVDAVTISGRYTVLGVTSADAFLIVAKTLATSGVTVAMNAGRAGLVYHISNGPQAPGGVYGSGAYGDGAYGMGESLVGQPGVASGAPDWSLDNWGELLIANPEDHGIYYWGPASGFLNVSLVANAPFYNNGAFVSIGQQMIIAFGSTVRAGIGVYQDPLMVKWCDSENFFDWTATETNQAGSYRIPTGSRCVGGAATPHQNLIWTDLDLWSMTYIGSQFVFAFNKIGANCGLISKHSHAQLAGNVYWMGWQSFFMLNGTSGVTELNCPVWDAVFQDLDITNAYKCRAGSNTAFSEVWFFYPSKSGGLGICDKYVKYDTIENLWDMGSLQRNTWLDMSILGGPIACTESGLVYLHENSKDAGNSPLNYYYETGWFFIDKGEGITFVDRIYPDFKWGDHNGSQNANVLVTVKTVNYPGETPKIYGPYPVSKATQFISKRFRARQIMLRFEGNDMGSFTRMGMVRIRYCNDGRGV
jgi:hypothetical protein